MKVVEERTTRIPINKMGWTLVIRKGLRLLLYFGCHSFVQWGHLTFPLALLYNSGHHNYHEMENNIW